MPSAFNTDESEVTRAARLQELREQRRSVIITTTICLVFTAAIGTVALNRYNQADPLPRVEVKAATASSNTAAVSTTSTTATTVPLLLPTETIPEPAKITVAPQPTAQRETTTTLPALPPGLADLLTTTTAAVPADIVYGTNPGAIRIQSGAQTTVTLVVTNRGGSPGAFDEPNICPPTFQQNPPSSKICTEGSKVSLLGIGASRSFVFTFSATSDGTRSGAALAPGHYTAIFGYAFQITVTP